MLPIPAAAQRPNIVLILADDLGWTDLGCFGSDYYQTPHLDRLASRGTRFTAAYANAPNCAPTRACLMTGQYTPRHGIFTVGSAERGQARFRKLIPIKNTTELAPPYVTVAEVLSAAGYTTGHIGKWHLGNALTTRPQGQGFEVSIGSDIPIGRVGHFSPYYSSDLENGPVGEYLTDRLTDEAVRFIQEHRDGPFFLYLAHHAVHTPIRAKEELIAKYKSRPATSSHRDPVYAAMIESLDASVGRVVHTIDELGLGKNTLVIFFSDNGGHGRFTSNSPLRGSKGMLYEGGIRVPMIARWTGRIPEGDACDEPVMGADFPPTFAELAAAKAPHAAHDGVGLVPLLDFPGASLGRTAIYWHFPAYLEPYTREQGRWRTTPAGAIRKGDWKLHEFFEDGRLELYNLIDDIGETTNLAAQLPEKRDELYQALLAWQRTTNAPLPQELNPLYRP